MPASISSPSCTRQARPTSEAPLTTARPEPVIAGRHASQDENDASAYPGRASGWPSAIRVTPRASTRTRGESAANGTWPGWPSLQERLYAEGTRSLLIVFQAMDAAGKDGTIEHVMSGLNPQGVRVTSFKQPTPVELAHDFLWRCAAGAARRAARSAIFNRSHYEEVLVVRVHPEYLAARGSTAEGAHERVLEGAATTDIAAWERHLRAQRHAGRQVLPPRLQGRAARALPRPRRGGRARTGSSRPATSPSASTGTPTRRPTRRRCAPRAPTDAPWYVIPADHKWFMRTAVGVDHRPTTSRRWTRGSRSRPEQELAEMEAAVAELRAEG